MKLKSAILTLAVGTATLSAPVIPGGEMEWVQAYQYRPSEIENLSATSTSPIQKTIKDKDGNDLVSIAVFRDSDGKLHEVEIEDSRYEAMGKKDGFRHNPKKTEYQSLLQSIVPAKVEAAIAFDASDQAGSAGAATSLTYAHTVSGTNRLMVACAYWGSSQTLSSITYNGVSTSQVVAPIDNGGGEFYAMNYLIAPDTGTNNVVITLSGSAGIEGASGSYTGTDQTDPIDATRTEVAGVENTTSYSEAITSTVDNTWAVWCTRNYSGVVVSSGTNTALREQVLVNFGVLFADSNAAITPAGSRTLNLTSSTASNWFSDLLVTIIPSAAPPPSSDVIFF